MFQCIPIRGALYRSVTGETRSKEELWEKVHPACQNIPANVCRYLLDSTPERIKAALGAKVDTKVIHGE